MIGAGGRARGDTVALAAVAGGDLVVSRSRPGPEVGPMDKRRTGAREPYKMLAVAILRRALVEAMAGSVEARAWLLSDPLAAYLADALDVERSALIRAVAASTAGGARDG